MPFSKKLSIITINYNNLLGLRKTINSVVNQNFKDFEYIVIDGGSSDGCAAFIDECQKSITYSISEGDSGVYHAMNKGIEAAKGEYCLFLNSGDELYDNSVLEKYLKDIHTYDVICFDSVIRGDGSDYFTTHPEEMTMRFLWNTTLCHQSVLIKRKLLIDKKYDENLKLVSDWKFFINAFLKYNATYRKVEGLLSIYYTDGMSSNPKNFKLIEEERDSVLKKEFNMLYSEMTELDRLRSIFNLMLLSRKFKFLQRLKIIDTYSI